MGKHASPSSALPRKAVLGLLLTALILSLVVARATGAVGGDDEPAASEQTGAGPVTQTQGPDGADGQAGGEPDGAGRASGAGQSAASGAAGGGGREERGGRDTGPRSGSQRTDGSQEDLANLVEDMLEQPVAPPTTFRVSSFNVLGHSHTVAGGNKPGYASGPTRMGMALQILRSYDVDVVGLQEFEPPQNAAFLKRTGGAWDVYPGMKLGKKGVRNSIAWRTDTWQVVEARTFASPYFRGKRVPKPYVLLENKDTGQRVWFINIHNPTSNAKRGNNERWRDYGTTLQVNLADRLKAQTGAPVLLLGDFNERAEAFCRVTRGGTMRAAAGGSVGPGCRPPGDLGIDWIFGTLDVAFGDYARTRSGLVSRATDHPIVVADATVTPEDEATP